MRLKTDWTPVDTHIARYAYWVYEERLRTGIPGDAESDWFAGKALYDSACERGRLEFEIQLKEEYAKEQLKWLVSLFKLRSDYGESVNLDPGTLPDQQSVS